jgi:hypothetical protein
MVKPEDKGSSEDDEDMNSGPGASFASAEPGSFAELTARDANNKTAANTVHQTSIPDGEGGGDGEATLELRKRRRRWRPRGTLLTLRPSSIDHLDEQMRFNGLRWRHELKRRVTKDPNLQNLLTWIQYHPSPMDEPTRTLVEMVTRSSCNTKHCHMIALRMKSCC